MRSKLDSNRPSCESSNRRPFANDVKAFRNRPARTLPMEYVVVLIQTYSVLDARRLRTVWTAAWS
jgi:hypothetical protein